jgi:hypothetical protein
MAGTDAMKLSRRRRVRWLKPLALVVLFGLAMLTVGVLVLRAYWVHVGDKQLAAVLADLDDSEPSWRWNDVQARREVIPEAENSASTVLAAMKSVPRDWPHKPAAAASKLRSPMDPLPALPDRLQEFEPVSSLDTELAADLRTELSILASALTEARKVIDRPRGRYTVTWTKDFLSTRLDHVQEARRCAYLLGLDAAAQADDKDYDSALASTRGVLNAGRSIGDEPTIISQLVRMACTSQAIRDMERVLAQGQASRESLASTLALVADEASHNLLLIALQGERAAAPGVLSSFYTGELDLEQFSVGHYGPNPRGSLLAWLFIRPIMHMGDAAALEYLTKLTHAAQLPPDERRKQFETVQQEIQEIKRGKNLQMASVVLLLPQAARLAGSHDSNKAELNCAQIGMALECYRLAHGAWPETLNELVPGLLTAIPEDPFGSGRLHYRRLDDGVVVYSVGPDGKGNGGVLARQGPKTPNTDLGFRLWDPGHRRQSSALKRQNQRRSK